MSEWKAMAQSDSDNLKRLRRLIVKLTEEAIKLEEAERLRTYTEERQVKFTTEMKPVSMALSEAEAQLA